MCVCGLLKKNKEGEGREEERSLALKVWKKRKSTKGDGKKAGRLTKQCLTPLQLYTTETDEIYPEYLK